MNFAQLKAIDVHVHIEHDGPESAADSAAKRYFGEGAAARGRDALARSSAPSKSQVFEKEDS
jgi:hypothetical protein